MRKLLNFIMLTVVILSVSCGVNDSNNLSSLEGSWVEDMPVDSHPDVFQRLEYTFHSNNTYESARMIIDSKTNTILGYRHAGSGKFTKHLDWLTLKKEKIYSINRQPEPLYVKWDELVISEPTYNDLSTFEVRFQNNNMIWYYQNGSLYSNSIDKQVFIRK